MFSQRAIKKDSAGVAGTRKASGSGKDLWSARASAARGRLREPTKRRKLTKPGKDKPQSRCHHRPGRICCAYREARYPASAPVPET
jgi:hypothetical protein